MVLLKYDGSTNILQKMDFELYLNALTETEQLNGNNEEYMYKFELVLILSIIHTEPKDFLERAKNCCKMVKRLKGKI